jgi:hypothetical protein
VIVRLWLFATTLFLLGACSNSGAVATGPGDAPQLRQPIEQIPVDLDLVARIDLGRMRSALPPGTVDRLVTLVTADHAAPSDILVLALAKTDTLWLGIRPSFSPQTWDNVMVLEGDFSSIDSATLGKAFRPPRDLGGGFFSRNVWEPGSRTSPARLYTYLEKRWIVASSAEVQALERVIEGHHYERSFEPPARGVLSVNARLERIAQELKEASPKAARFLEKARALEASIDLDGRGVKISARMHFLSVEQAELAARAIDLFARLAIGAATLGHLDLDVEQIEQDVSIEMSVPQELLAQYLGDSAEN